jgi:hypothetical protein
MPYKLRKAPNKSLYWVVSVDTGKKHSKAPLEREEAEAQMRVLMAAMKDEDPTSNTIRMNRPEVIKEHVQLLGVLKAGTPEERIKEAVKQEKELKKYLSKPTEKIITLAKKFEDEKDLQTIKGAVLAIDCNKIDKEHVKTINKKEDLVSYLRSHNCPVLQRLEAALYKVY